MNKILIIDDETVILTSLKYLLEDKYEIYTSSDPYDGINILKKENINLILLDLRIGKVNGIDILKKILTINPKAYVIMMTAYSSIETSVEAIKLGAYYYITKPIESDKLLVLLERADEKIRLLNKKSCTHLEKNKDIIGNSKEIKEIIKNIDTIKDFNVNVLISGESGTGKELIAQKIHYSSNRGDKPFYAINCAAIPDNLLESELFGYKKGAFTGAVKDEKGIIRNTDKGTLFLDEIGEMDLHLQSKILRFLQEKEVSPVGSSDTYNVDVRVICATNRDLKKEAEEGRFRRDLYYRINVVNIDLPPLRARKEDIEILSNYFISKYSKIFNKDIVGISKEAIKILKNYKFEGNIRELENIIERGVIMTPSNIIEVSSINLQTNKINEYNDKVEDNINLSNIDIKPGESMKEIEKKSIIANLEYFNQNRKKTAEALGISERTLRYKIKEYNL